MAEDILERDLVTGLAPETVLEISRMTIHYILFRAMDYIENPRQREQIQLETERFINRQFRGALLEHLSQGEVQAMARPTLQN
jgi:hypothetical protein